MGKNTGVILGIIGILLGAGGLAFGLISWMSASPSQRSWYDYVDLDGISTTGENIAGLSLTVSLNSGEELYVLFTCTVECDGLWAAFYVYIDGFITSGYTRVSRDAVGGVLYFSASIQHVNNTLSAGAHTITVWAQTDDIGTDAIDSVLFAQTI